VNTKKAVSIAVNILSFIILITVGVFIYIIISAKQNGEQGVLIDYLQTQTGFFLCLVMPLALIFIWRLIILVRIFMKSKKVCIKKR